LGAGWPRKRRRIPSTLGWPRSRICVCVSGAGDGAGPCTRCASAVPLNYIPSPGICSFKGYPHDCDAQLGLVFTCVKDGAEQTTPRCFSPYLSDVFKVTQQVVGMLVSCQSSVETRSQNTIPRKICFTSLLDKSDPLC
jgi:hypothetical protein